MLDEAKETIHPTVVAVANNQKFRVLLDTGAGGSFVSSTFIKHINQKPLYWESKEMETITTTVTQNYLHITYNCILLMKSTASTSKPTS